MISHKLKCIFIHIPRTAGSSIERALINNDWWRVDKKTKHLVASQAKKIYSEYWNDYFKFSFVRNPYSRMISMLGYNKNMRQVYSGDTSRLDGKIAYEHVNGYKNLFGSSVLIEYDHRFYKREEVENERHKPNCVYTNILDEPIDYIGKFETLEEDFNTICNNLGLKEIKLIKIGGIRHNHILSVEAKTLINELYDKDFLTYNYSKE